MKPSSVMLNEPVALVVRNGLNEIVATICLVSLLESYCSIPKQVEGSESVLRDRLDSGHTLARGFQGCDEALRTHKGVGDDTGILVDAGNLTELPCWNIHRIVGRAC